MASAARKISIKSADESVPFLEHSPEDIHETFCLALEIPGTPLGVHRRHNPCAEGRFVSVIRGQGDDLTIVITQPKHLRVESDIKG